MLQLARCGRLWRQPATLRLVYSSVKRQDATLTQPTEDSPHAHAHAHPVTGQPKAQGSNIADVYESKRSNVADFHRFADMYLGGLWNRIESQLRAKEGEKFDYDVNVTSGCLALRLPDDGFVKICKLPEEQSLHVESNLHDVYGGGDPRDEACFRLNDDGDFEDGGMVLHTYLESHLAHHLKVQLDLEPQSSPSAKVYTHDPT